MWYNWVMICLENLKHVNNEQISSSKSDSDPYSKKKLYFFGFRIFF